ncbi:MAG: 50S ribosomal protein L25 [bacterium]
MITLAVTKRELIGRRTKRLSKDGQMPAVVYGPKHESTPVTLLSKDFERAFKVAGESSVIEISGLGGTVQALIHEVDVDPVTGVARHADFYAIEKGAKVEVAVPLSFTGESAAVKAGANLVKVMHEVEIEAAPADLPHEIEVDLAALAALGDKIHASDLKMPKGVTLKTDPEEVVALTQEVEEEKEEAPAAVDMAGIEVEKKGKTEEEGAAAEGEAKE